MTTLTNCERNHSRRRLKYNNELVNDIPVTFEWDPCHLSVGPRNIRRTAIRLFRRLIIQDARPSK